jgi:vacuolar-type H+-ATPase subunit D/Vma8
VWLVGCCSLAIFFIKSINSTHFGLIVVRSQTMAATIELKTVKEKDEALMCLLRSVNELYEEQQKGAKSMRKGFLNMAKARQSMGRGQ